MHALNGIPPSTPIALSSHGGVIPRYAVVRAAPDVHPVVSFSLIEPRESCFQGYDELVARADYLLRISLSFRTKRFHARAHLFIGERIYRVQLAHDQGV